VKMKFVILFMVLMGFPSIIMKGNNDSSRETGALSELELINNTSVPKFAVSFGLWERVQDKLGTMSGLYLVVLLRRWIKEHPIKAIVAAIVLGIFTNENKKNIIAGIKKLRSSAYRVMNFDFKKAEKNKKDEQKRGIRFIELADLNEAEMPKSDKKFVFDV